jgi:hypothetical protein
MRALLPSCRCRCRNLSHRWHYHLVMMILSTMHRWLIPSLIGFLGGCGPCRSGRLGSGLSYPFPYNTRCSRARGFPRRSPDGADHVWTVSECYDHNGVPKAWYTGRRRRRQRTNVVVRTRFVVGALICCVRFSRSRRVRNLDNHSLSDASPATSNGGLRRLRSRSPIKQ